MVFKVFERGDGYVGTEVYGCGTTGRRSHWKYADEFYQQLMKTGTKPIAG